MKIRFQKLKVTDTFTKLFGARQNKPDSPPLGTAETDEAYEYYYKRGNTYYFRNEKGSKFSIDCDKPQKELIKGNKYKMDAINNLNS